MTASTLTTNATSSGDERELDARLTELIVGLQLATTRVNLAIETTTARALSSVPRSIREIERIRKEAALRNRKLAAYSDALSRAELAAGDSFIANLSELDAVKQRLESSAALLRQARRVYESSELIERLLVTLEATPSSTSSATSSLSSSSSSSASTTSTTTTASDTQSMHAQLASELRSLQRSLVVLGDVAHFDAQRIAVERQKARFEALLQLRLARAVDERNASDTQQLLELYDQIGAAERFVQTYHECRERSFIALWRRCQAEHGSSSSSTSSAHDDTQVVAAFYAAALGAIRDEARWLELALPTQVTVTIICVCVCVCVC